MAHRSILRRVRVAAVLLAASAALVPAACDRDPTRPPAERELDRARATVARYQDLATALADGYVDAHIVMQNMGHHYLNAALLDDRFEPERPEILVYAPDSAGHLQFVAVEYAVPLDRADSAPAGFAGTGDQWSRNTKYGLWTLHAWLGLPNAAGVFNATNARIQLDPGSLEGNRMPTTH